MPVEEVLEEVRRVREARAAEFDFDLKALFADARSRQGHDGRTVVPEPPRSPEAVPRRKDSEAA